MFDYYKLLEKQTDRTFRYIYDSCEKRGVEIGDRFNRFLRWIGYKLLPFLFGVSTFITLFWIVKVVKDKFGFETAILFLLVLILLKRSDD